EHWPRYGFGGPAFRARRYRWHRVPPMVDTVLARVRDEGPVTTTDLGGARNGGPWWDWSDVKIAVEWLLDIGEVVCTRRIGWRRTYELAERAIPADLLKEDLSDAECVARLAGVAGRALGVATRGDIADFFRVNGDRKSVVE